MDNIQLIRCAESLCGRWKDHFGLHTYYVGYLTIDLLISILTVWRFSEPKEFEQLSGNEISALVEDKLCELREKTGQEYAFFSRDKDIDTVMPKLIEELNKSDLSKSNIPQEQWDTFIEYLKSKRK